MASPDQDFPLAIRQAAWVVLRIIQGVAISDEDRALLPGNGWQQAAQVAEQGYDAFDQWNAAQEFNYLRAVMAEDARVKPCEEPAEDTWTIYDLTEAYKPRPPLQYVVNGLFLLPSLNIAYGSPGTFKSMLLADACVCVAAGLPWLSPLPDKDDVAPRGVTRGPVLWVDFDNGLRRTNERLEALARARELDPSETPLYYASMPVPWLDASDALAMDDLAQRILTLGAVLVVIDNLGNVCGKADENSTDMADVMASFRRLAEHTGAAIVLIHHQRKATGYNSRAGESLRGHSSIEAALDLALLIEREERADTVKLRSTKVRGTDVPPFGAVFTYEHREGTDELARARFFGRSVEDVFSDVAVRRTILEVVQGHPDLNKTSLKSKVKEVLADVGINRIGDNIDVLVDKGELALQSGARGAKFYRIATHEQAQLA